MHTFADPLARAERVAAARVAVVDGDRQLTYAELGRRCRRLAGALGELTEPGDRVAVLAANSAPYLELYVTVPASGRVIVPLNTRHAEPELRYALTDGGVRVLFCDRDPGGLADVVERVVRIDEIDGASAYEDLVAAASPVPLGTGVESSSLAGLFYTGGTTGASKGVMLTHANLIANAINELIACGFTDADSYLVMAPMFHAAGTVAVLSMIWAGGTQVMLGAFDPAKALELIETHHVTATLGVPTMIAALADTQLASGRDVSSLRHLSHGGSPIASEVVRRAAKAFGDAELVHLYGATETAPLATALRDEQELLDSPLIRSCGPAVIGVEVRVATLEGTDPLPDGDIGEVLVRGANVMAGYWNKPEQTAAVLVDGWYRTGDLGWMDDQGRVYLVDRAKDMIVTGGENVYSTEVEEVLFLHPDVKEACVFGIPDERWGEAVHAVVVPARSDVDTAALVEFCRSHIATYKVPKSIELRDTPLPVSGPGKVLKRELRRPFWEGSERTI